PVLDHRRARGGGRPGPVLRRHAAGHGAGPLSYETRRFLVAGAGVAGGACAEVLLGLVSRVTVGDRTDSEALARLRDAGASVLVGHGVDAVTEVDEVVVSPGFAPHPPLAR